jgi:hypothetical protein
MTWRDERHVTVSIASDVSGWGGTLLGDGDSILQEVRYAWDEPMLPQPIHIRETVALSHTLLALADHMRNSCVDVRVDSRVLLDCWDRHYSRLYDMLVSLKDIFWATVALNVALCLKYVPSRHNPADAPSCRISEQDCSLSPRLWFIVQRTFGGVGGHMCDLMALDSNAQHDLHKIQLPHFAPVSMPYALAVNLFSQNISVDTHPRFSQCYIFQPIQLIGPVLRFCVSRRHNVPLSSLTVLPDHIGG